MSWQASSWALRQAPVGSDTTARLLLMALADRAHPDGTATWPSVATLMKELQVSESTIRRKLAWLENNGVIERGDQSLAAHDEHGRTIPSPYRPVVWNLRMDSTIEPIAETQPQSSTLRDNSDRGVKMTPLEESQNKAISRPVKMTPLKKDSGSRGVMGASVGVSPVTDKPIYKPNNPLPPKGGISLEKNNLDVSMVEEALSQALSLTYKPERKDHVAARSLIDTYGLDTVLAVIAWCTAPASAVPGSKRDGFWRGVLRGVAGLAKHWDVIVTQMREDPTGGKKLKSLQSSEDSRLQMSLLSATRYKLYGSSKLTTGQGWEHLDNETPSDECVACDTDPRNKQFHGVGVRDKLSDTPAEHSDRAHLSRYHFIGHRTTTNIHATSKE
jgi:DNA-binding transcriptional regulator YhcF (GntR family)